MRVTTFQNLKTNRGTRTPSPMIRTEGQSTSSSSASLAPATAVMVVMGGEGSGCERVESQGKIGSRRTTPNATCSVSSQSAPSSPSPITTLTITTSSSAYTTSTTSGTGSSTSFESAAPIIVLATTLALGVASGGKRAAVGGRAGPSPSSAISHHVLTKKAWKAVFSLVNEWMVPGTAIGQHQHMSTSTTMTTTSTISSPWTAGSAIAISPSHHHQLRTRNNGRRHHCSQQQQQQNQTRLRSLDDLFLIFQPQTQRHISSLMLPSPLQSTSWSLNSSISRASLTSSSSILSFTGSSPSAPSPILLSPSPFFTLDILPTTPSNRFTPSTISYRFYHTPSATSPHTSSTRFFTFDSPSTPTPTSVSSIEYSSSSSSVSTTTFFFNKTRTSTRSPNNTKRTSNNNNNNSSSNKNTNTKTTSRLLYMGGALGGVVAGAGTGARMWSSVSVTYANVGDSFVKGTRSISTESALAPASSMVAAAQTVFLWWERKASQSLFEVFDRALPNTRKTFQFRNAASAVPKDYKHPQLPNSSQYLSVQVGEDAYFNRHDSMGVADGVGGWRVKEANPAMFSMKIMHYSSEQLEVFDDIAGDYDIREYYNIDPQKVLDEAYQRTSQDAKSDGIVGSTTALLVILRDDELRICNIGDCGLMIIRENELIFRTEEQQHSFNFPFQLGTNSRDSPKDAQTYRVKVREGDLVIVGSDGIFDNVFDDEILDIVKVCVGGKNISVVDPQIITDALLERARSVAEDSKNATSPFQTRAIQEGVYYQGGKMDDVTVLAEDSPDRR
ncbi:hypothetical protein HDU76_008486 [Blyttiomyces sp. JEL0837]|nr:hypothetical protein HDU76_008486 [Blyttiomyces sp. JEL0837]